MGTGDATDDELVPTEHVDRAASDARSAADRAGVVVRTLTTHDELAGARRLWDLTWPSPGEGTQVTANLLRAVEHGGGYVSGAYDGSGLVGACLGLVSRHHRDGRWVSELHSHMAAVAPGCADRGIGAALKYHQRAWALAHDLATITWTFDPLVRRNARLNLVKLGAVATEYLPDFYGDMEDDVNAGDPSDRLMVRWQLASQRVAEALAGAAAPPSSAELRVVGAVDGLLPDEKGVPVLTGRGGPVLLVAVPADIAQLRRTDPGRATQWRYAMRDALLPAVSAGGAVVSLTAEGDYVVEVVS